ncbi:hypothetical protein Cgig2_014154 [Carnegiea gigantea]|uniref:LMBR1-like membrane protein n=1 Tax=Carnegiea gigantea TaxID=171969 RepID=A0A9Q1JH05_9CARY|nr:hypothetical protein Cgig2_014154 [Carnegiea gigantea]
MSSSPLRMPGSVLSPSSSSSLPTFGRAVVPLIQGYEDAGDFTVTERNQGVLGFAMACSNTFGLVTGAFLLGFGLSEIPRSLWKNADWAFQLKVLSHKIAKMAVKLDDAHQNFSNAIVVAQATSNQMSKRDPLRPYMDVIDKMLAQMFKEDPSFKPQGGRLGENDMDYDADDKSMATLRRQLRVAYEEYYRYKSEYMKYVLEALELEDTIKNYERRDATGWKYVSSLRGSRSGQVGSFLDTIELLWRCILRKQLQRLLAIILGGMSIAILLAEATLLPRVDLSLFSILIKSVGRQELFVQVFAFIPLMMVARYAPPVSYNFLNLIRLDGNAKTIFEQRMGNIDDAVPFFGRGFNRIYPLIMVVYTILVASNFFNRVIDYFGSWKIFKFRTEADDMDGFDPSGMIILQKERSWLEQGHKVGEQVIPLARNFNDASMDVESGMSKKDNNAVEMKGSSAMDGIKGNIPKKSNVEARQYSENREAIGHKYTAMREQNRPKPVENTMASAKISLLNAGSSDSVSGTEGPSSGLSSTWRTMKSGFQNFKANIGSRKFLPLRQTQEAKLMSHDSSSDSLDDIFQRLKRPTREQATYDDDGDDDDTEISNLGPRR